MGEERDTEGTTETQIRRPPVPPRPAEPPGALFGLDAAGGLAAPAPWRTCWGCGTPSTPI
ncbi:hypothetical protein JNW87_34990, partial [Micromonospora sp. ATA51]|nr:hypothetical protein [Micromonospora sp. ATA51]